MFDEAGVRAVGFRNLILAALPAEELDQLCPCLGRVPLVLGQVLHEVGNPIEDVYFLEDGLVCLVANTGDNGRVEVGMTGRDGLIGGSVLLNPAAIALHRAVVHAPGVAYRMQTIRLRELVDHSPALRDRCLRYLQFTLVQASQLAACNARHELPARLARWLLMARDLSGDNELPLTQEFLSDMLGVRRAGVSGAVRELGSKGLIRQARRLLTILDDAGLEREACSCYLFVEDSRRQIGLPALAR